MREKTYDDDLQLLCLLQYYKGKAREAIEECVMLPPEVRYAFRGIFLGFRKKSLDGFFERGNKRRLDTDTLSGLAVRMNAARLPDLNSPDPLGQKVKQLPYPLQTQ